MKNKMESGKLTFFELFDVFRKSNTSLKFETRQGTTFVGVDKGGSLLVSKK